MKKTERKNRVSYFWCHAGALLFACFMVFGRSFEKTDSWELVLGGTPEILLSLLQGIGWYLAFLLGIYGLFRCLDHAFVLESRGGAAFCPPGWLRLLAAPFRKYWEMVQNRPFKTVFCTLLLVNLPYMALSYPGIFMGDSSSQISQGLGEAELTNHHPVTHTLILSAFLHLGKWIGDENAGIFLYCLAQAVLVCAALAYAAGALVKIPAGKLLVAGVLLYDCLQPRISAYLFLVTKDVPYSACFTLFYVTLIQLFRRRLSRGEAALLGISAVGMVLLRNDGKFVVVLSLAAALFCRRCRKTAGICLAAAVIAAAGVSRIVLPAIGAEPGSIREMLSVPFQQTARYVRDAGGDITDEEAEVIGRVLDFGSLAEIYDPDISDNVKATYHGSAEDLKDYFGVWFRMLLRHPGIYIQATMNNYYQYFYPGEVLFNNYSYSWSESIMETINERLDTDFHYPEALRGLRDGYESLREDLFSLPLLSLFNTPALYTWAAVLYLCYCLYRRSLIGFLAGVPMIVQMLIFITGPTNGFYCRYEYAMLLYLPAVLPLGLKLMKTAEEEPALLSRRR